jgi:hypothetical protein
MPAKRYRYILLFQGTGRWPVKTCMLAASQFFNLPKIKLKVLKMWQQRSLNLNLPSMQVQNCTAFFKANIIFGILTSTCRCTMMTQGFIQWFTPGMNLTWGDIPPSTWVFWKFFFWSFFENLITLTNFKWNFKAFRSRIKHFKVLKTHQAYVRGGYFHLKKIK